MKTLLLSVIGLFLLTAVSCSNGRTELNTTSYIIGNYSPDITLDYYNSYEEVAVSYKKEYNVGDTVLLGKDNIIIPAPSQLNKNPKVVYILHKFK